jgi:hypothetical protein
MLEPGSTFLVPSGPQGKHLFFLVLGPLILPEYGKSPHVVSVGASTIHQWGHYDPACVLQVGDHPFISHQSYIAYRYARIDPASHIEKMIGGTWPERERCSQELLDRIIHGVTISKFAPRDLKEIFLHH